MILHSILLLHHITIATVGIIPLLLLKTLMFSYQDTYCYYNYHWCHPTALLQLIIRSTHTCMYTHTQICMHTHIHSHTCTHTHTHTHTRIHTHNHNGHWYIQLSVNITHTATCNCILYGCKCKNCTLKLLRSGKDHRSTQLGLNWTS